MSHQLTPFIFIKFKTNQVNAEYKYKSNRLQFACKQERRLLKSKEQYDDNDEGDDGDYVDDGRGKGK